MALVGYARVSTLDQDYKLQLDALKKQGCDKIFAEKKSATSRTDRTKLDECLEYLREGDTLVVTRIDRLARSLRDLQNMVHDLNANGRVENQPQEPKQTQEPYRCRSRPRPRAGTPTRAACA